MTPWRILRVNQQPVVADLIRLGDGRVELDLVVEAEELVVDVLDEGVVEEGEEVWDEILDVADLADRDLAAVLTQGGADDVGGGQRRMRRTVPPRWYSAGTCEE